MPELKDRFLEIEKELFADEQSSESQWGKLSYEGIWKRSHFRSMKMYDLADPVDGKVGGKRRVKGIPKRLACDLPESSFKQTDIDRPVVNTRALRPTPALGIGIFSSRRTLSACMNRKRKCEVRV